MSRTLVPNSTQAPDAIFDQWLPLLTPIETKIVFFIVRKTFGWGKKHDKLGLTQIVTGAGLSAASVRRACASLEAVGVLLIRHAPGGNTVNDYALNLNNADAVEDRLKARSNSADLSQGDTGIREIPVSGRRETSISVTSVPISGRYTQETLLETRETVIGADAQKNEDLPRRKTGKKSASSKADPKSGNGGFVPPTLEQVREYMAHLGVEHMAEECFDHHDTRGWKLKSGEYPVKWEGCCRTWKNNAPKFARPDYSGERRGAVPAPVSTRRKEIFIPEWQKQEMAEQAARGTAH